MSVDKEKMDYIMSSYHWWTSYSGKEKRLMQVAEKPIGMRGKKCSFYVVVDREL